MILEKDIFKYKIQDTIVFLKHIEDTSIRDIAIS